MKSCECLENAPGKRVGVELCGCLQSGCKKWLILNKSSISIKRAFETEIL
jgi:hypothetical protein